MFFYSKINVFIIYARNIHVCRPIGLAFWKRTQRVCDVGYTAGGVRCFCEPSRSVHLLFPLRAQYDSSRGVDDGCVQIPDVHDHYLEHRYLDEEAVPEASSHSLPDFKTLHLPIGLPIGCRMLLINIHSSVNTYTLLKLLKLFVLNE